MNPIEAINQEEDVFYEDTRASLIPILATWMESEYLNNDTFEVDINRIVKATIENQPTEAPSFNPDNISYQDFANMVIYYRISMADLIGYLRG